jgi:hypothetical protein
LGLNESILDESYEVLSRHHQLLKAFVERRGQHPVGTETTNLPASAATVFNLHAGRFRALTWHDESDDVVWLLGLGWHEEGSRDDAYAYLKGLDLAGRLMPDENDYERFYKQRFGRGETSFTEPVRAASEIGPRILADVMGSAGEFQEAELAGVLGVRIRVIQCAEDAATFKHRGLLRNATPATGDSSVR